MKYLYAALVAVALAASPALAEEAPLPPPLVLATQTLQLTVSFRDNSTNEDGFRIERGDASCSNFQAVQSALPPMANTGGTVSAGDTIPGDIGNVTYCYRAFAFNSAGDSLPSNTATITSPSIISIPTAVSGVIVTIVGVSIP